ncbi:MAG: hypothetical protein Q9225_005722 [Loekoesia sp. 1 TL-2023]
MAGDRQDHEQSIAIIGMGCRLPGQVDSPSDFWNLMMAARSPQSMKVPMNRFNVDAFYHSQNERPGSLNVPGGYFLEGDPTDFDPTFFGITPVEATWMDPQQRKLLEVVYEALESSGTPLHKVLGSLTGCFVGSFTSDFQQMSFKEQDFRHTYSATGVDPAALVGGSNLILTIDQHMNTAKLGVLSPTSQCHTFDESADGYARAEGVGALYIKSLGTALKDGDPIRAVIRSTAVNSNGRTPGVGISHPSVQGQFEVIRLAYEKAGFDPSQTGYVECHGTGTPAGDPKELQAITQAIAGESQELQPLLVGSIGLVKLLAEWNVFPTVTVGHSSGEIAAAFAAGYLSAEDAILIAFYRGKVVASASSSGAMLAVGLGAVEVLPYLEGYKQRVVVACHNSPNSVTLSGDADAIDELKACLGSRKIFARELRTGGKAYHSHHMTPTALKYRDLLRNTDLCNVTIPQNRKRCQMISTVSNNFMNDKGIDSTYWALNLESPVLFNQAILTLTETMPGLDMVLEIGPHPALSGPIRQIAKGTDRTLSHIPTLKRGENDVDQLLALAGELWAKSSPIDITAVTSVERSLASGYIENISGSLLVDLPTYQWNYSKKYLSEPRQSREHRGCKHPRHDLLGRKLPGLSLAEPQWRNMLRLSDIPWLRDHTLGNEVVFPAAGYFAMAIEAATQMNVDSVDTLDIRSFTLRKVSIETALVVPDDDNGVETLFAIRSCTRGSSLPAKNSSRQWYTFSVSSIGLEEKTWNQHASGMIGVNKGPRSKHCPRYGFLGSPSKDQSPQQEPLLPLYASGKSWYRSLHQVGFNYGPTFQKITKIHTDHKLRAASCEAKVGLESGLISGESSYTIHPGTVDCCLQSIIVSIYAGKLSGITHGFVPIGIDSITFWTTAIRDQEPSKINTWVYDGSKRHYSANSQLVSTDGRLILDLQGVHCVAYEAAVPPMIQRSQQKLPYWRVQWLPDLGLTPVSEALTVFPELNITDVVALLRHNIVSTRILDIGGEFTSDLINSNAFLDITVSVPTEELLQSKKDSLKDHSFVKILKLDIASKEHDSSLDTVYDLIIASEARPEDQVILLADFDQAVLHDLQDDELKGLQGLAQNAAHILWVTAGGLLSGRNPEHAMFSGLARCLRSENVSLDLVTVDIDRASTSIEQMTEIIRMFADRQAEGKSKLEAEYLVDAGMIHVGRLAPIDAMNETCALLIDEAELSALECTSSLEATVQSGKLYFQDQDEALKPLGSTEAEVKVFAIGISRAQTPDTAGHGYQSVSCFEIGGVVTALGSEVSHLRVEDRVVGFASDDFSTSRRTLAMHLCPIGENDPFEVSCDFRSCKIDLTGQTMVSLPIAFSTAIHGLQELAHVGEGETVLILDNTGAAGFAAMQVCRISGARFIVMTEKEDVYAGLLNSGFTDDELILCRDGNMSDEIQRRTEGRGADVLFGEHTADVIFLQDCALYLTPHARIILVGGRNSHLDGLNDWPISGELSISVFSIFDLCQRKPKTAARLLQTCVQLHKDGMISNAIPTHSSSVSYVDEVVSRFSNNIVSGKSVISYENHPMVKTLPSQPSLRFDPNAVYLLIGCLGGLGRSLTSWMVDRGARYLAFLARSGSERPAAANLVSTIEARGVEVTVLKGDVAKSEDVDAAVRTITQYRQLRGVVNAAMVLNDGLFQSMDLASWRSTVDPKVKGSLNLHEAVKELDLDFFVLLSSTSGILGTPSQSNYAAANAYQDALALHRRALSLPAVSLILPMILGVGYVADNPEIEDSLLRKGIYGIHEDELLAGFEAAMKPQRNGNAYDNDAHIILGFDPEKLARSVAQAETTDAFWLDDPRFSTIVAMMKRMTRNNISGGPMMTSTGSIIADIRSAKSSPSDAIASITTCVRQRLARLLNLNAEEDIVPEDARSVASYGLDSMIGTEFRNWLFREFGADVPYQRLLAPSLTIEGLAGVLYEGVSGGGNRE